jgi:transposase IS66 family protein
VLKFPDERRTEGFITQTTYTRGSSGVSGRVCEQRYAAERVLPQYALTLWRKLTRFLEYPELELSNNLAENSIRPVALGRKNWIHIGSPPGGPEDRGDSLGRGKLPQVETPSARLSGRGSPRVCRSPDPAPPSPYSRSVGHPAFMDSSDRVVR